MKSLIISFDVIGVCEIEPLSIKHLIQNRFDDNFIEATLFDLDVKPFGSGKFNKTIGFYLEVKNGFEESVLKVIEDEIRNYPNSNVLENTITKSVMTIKNKKKVKTETKYYPVTFTRVKIF